MLVAKFGALEVCTAEAINRMNVFYAETEFLEHKITVHGRLGERLKLAETLLTRQPLVSTRRLSQQIVTIWLLSKMRRQM